MPPPPPPSHPRAALLKLLNVAVPCFVETVKKEQERQVVMGVLETMNGVIKSCKEHVFKNPKHLQKVSHAIRDVLKKKVRAGRDARAVEKSLVLEPRPILSFFSFFFFGSVQTVCQDSGEDGDDDDHQVSPSCCRV